MSGIAPGTLAPPLFICKVTSRKVAHKGQPVVSQRECWGFTLLSSRTLLGLVTLPRTECRSFQSSQFTMNFVRSLALA